MRAYSVVIPAYMSAPFISDTLASLMAQTAAPERIIVVDDGSTDETGAIVKSLQGPITYVFQKNTGPGGATSRGLALAETEFVATVDADDLWLPRKAELQLARLAAAPEVDAVFSRVAEFRGDPSRARLDAAYDGWTRATLMMRTRIAQEAGPMVDHPSKLGELVDWLAVLREKGHKLEMMADVLALRRLHEGSLTAKSREELSRSYLFLARRALARRRERDSENR